MGCVVSKKRAVSITPAFDSSGILRDNHDSRTNSPSSALRADGGRYPEMEVEEEGEGGGSKESGGASGESDAVEDSLSFRLGNLHRYIEGEQVAAGWPAWLAAVAGEAIYGWVPLKSDSFEKLEKIGQGTYSSVFRARDLDTGKIFALKKVRFDNFEPESVQFMAREIKILRRLDHPNVIKLEGLIASRLSCSLYLVFEYMEHDLAGLSSCPDIKFSESQMKCYTHQLLSGLEHCHSHCVIHRDIKGANLLINDEGILKIADFGLAKFYNTGERRPLTSRVVTLWYRPPELLLGSTDYEASVDLWSVGCVFAEMFLGKPILQGRTEVEQLHKIFKLCGSPPEEYWRKSKLPHATIFKPHHPYSSCLKEVFKSLPATAFSLLETFLSVEPYKRGTASAALSSEYFKTKPYASDPSNLPKYPPNKEMDAKIREESKREKVSAKIHVADSNMRTSKTHRMPREKKELYKLDSHIQEPRINTRGANNYGPERVHPKCDTRLFVDLHPIPAIRPQDEGRHVKHISQGDVPFSGPLHVPPSSGFACAKNPSSRTRVSGAIDASTTLRSKSSFISGMKEKEDNITESHNIFGGHEQTNELRKLPQLERQTSYYDGSAAHHSHEISQRLHRKDSIFSRGGILKYQDERDRVEFSGPLLSQVHKVDELLEKHDRHIRQAARRSWFRKGRRQAR